MLDKLNNLSTPVKLVVAVVIAAVIIAAAFYGPVPGVSAMQDKNKADQATLTKQLAVAVGLALRSFEEL
jgi:hypothetical protein